jgi:hypothetical protein
MSCPVSARSLVNSGSWRVVAWSRGSGSLTGTSARMRPGDQRAQEAVQRPRAAQDHPGRPADGDRDRQATSDAAEAGQEVGRGRGGQQPPPARAGKPQLIARRGDPGGGREERAAMPGGPQLPDRDPGGEDQPPREPAGEPRPSLRPRPPAPPRPRMAPRPGRARPPAPARRRARRPGRTSGSRRTGSRRPGPRRDGRSRRWRPCCASTRSPRPGAAGYTRPSSAPRPGVGPGPAVRTRARSPS